MKANARTKNKEQRNKENKGTKEQGNKGIKEPVARWAHKGTGGPWGVQSIKNTWTNVGCADAQAVHKSGGSRESENREE
jgi:hypothetical protein